MAEFIDTMHQFAGTGVDEKLVFLFKVYDLDGKFDQMCLCIKAYLSIKSQYCNATE